MHGKDNLLVYQVPYLSYSDHKQKNNCLWNSG